MESATRYAKSVLIGFRKVRNRIADAGWKAEEANARMALVEELAQEVLTNNLPRRVKQWVRIAKPTTLESLVKVIEDEECEEKEERMEESRRRPSRPQNQGYQREVGLHRLQDQGYSRDAGSNRPQHQGYQRETGWKVVEGRGHNRVVRSKPTGPSGRSYERGKRENFKNQNYGYQRWTPPRTGRCYECNEVGHFARECPWMFRRAEHQQQPRSYADAARRHRSEPMEVNAGEMETRKWRQYSSTDEGSEGETRAPGKRETPGHGKRSTDGSDKE